jgi:hypothetical protein
MFTVDETLEWVSGKQFIWEGELGFVPFDLTYARLGETLTYNVRDRRGTRSDRLGQLGTTRLDGFASPLGWVRRFNHLVERGGAVQVEAFTDGAARLRVLPKQPGPPLFFTIDDSKHQLLEVQIGEGETAASWKYTDWKTIDGAQQFHAPRRVEIRLGTTTYSKVVTVARVLDTHEVPPPPELPGTAIIDDQLSGQWRQADGTPVPMQQVVPPATPDASVLDASQRDWSRIAGWLAALAFASAGIVLAVRSRSKRGPT